MPHVTNTVLLCLLCLFASLNLATETQAQPATQDNQTLAKRRKSTKR